MQLKGVLMEGVKIELDKMRIVRFDWNALAAYDDVAKESLLISAQTGNVTFSMLLNMLWAGLIHEEPSLSPKRVGVILTDSWTKKGKTPGELLVVLREAMQLSGLFEMHKEETPKKKRAARKSKTLES